MALFLKLIEGGLWALWEYVVHHIITCLIPAFLLAGAFSTFVSKETIVKLMGSGRVRGILAAAFGSFFVAVCSCTVIPIAAGLQRRGASWGSVFTLLWVAPAANILSLVYTGSILGPRYALVRLGIALALALLVGLAMALLFDKEITEQGSEIQNPVSWKALVVLVLLILSLLAPNYLGAGKPYAVKVAIWFPLTLASVLSAFWLEREQFQEWLENSWWFVKLILPYLLVGVFVVGVVKVLLEGTNWVRIVAGSESLTSAALASLVGCLSYFATMTEAPFVDALLKLGMAKGAALALLLTGPGVSLPNLLAISKAFGYKRALAYGLLIFVLGSVAGWLAGLFLL